MPQVTILFAVDFFADITGHFLKKASIAESIE